MDNFQIEVFHFPPSHKEWPQKLYSAEFMNCTIVIAVHMLHRPKPKKPSMALSVNYISFQGFL